MNPFTTYQFRKMPVRIVRKSDKNYFVIRDICNILGWSNPNRELAKHTENVPLYERIRTPGGLQVVRLVPRADVEKLLAAGTQGSASGTLPEKRSISQAGRGGKGNGAGQSSDRGIHFHDAHTHDGTVFRRQISWRTQ